jgi:hypothetical protein
MGMEADTVSPAFNARYTVDDPNKIPNNAPKTTDFTVNSATFFSGGMKGLKVDLLASMYV